MGTGSAHKYGGAARWYSGDSKKLLALSLWQLQLLCVPKLSMAIASRVPGRSQSPAAGALEMTFPYAPNTRGNTATQNTPISNALCHGDERPPLPAICGRSWWLVFELLKGHLCLQDSTITWRLLAWHPIPVHVVPQRCFWGRSSDSSCPRHTVTIPKPSS